MTKLKQNVQDVVKNLVTVLVLFHAIVGILYMYHNWQELLVNPFVKNTKVINVEAKEILSPLAEK